MKDEPSDTTMAFIWNLAKFADAVSFATNYVHTRTKYRQAGAMARKHARRLMSLADIHPNDPDSRKALEDLLGGPR